MRSRDLHSNIETEKQRYHAFYGRVPEYVFIGRVESAVIEDMINDLRKWGLMPQGEPIPRAKFCGMDVFVVDAPTHLSFGNAQPSPCG